MLLFIGFSFITFLSSSFFLLLFFCCFFFYFTNLSSFSLRFVLHFVWFVLFFWNVHSLAVLPGTFKAPNDTSKKRKERETVKIAKSPFYYRVFFLCGICYFSLISDYSIPSRWMKCTKNEHCLYTFHIQMWKFHLKTTWRNNTNYCSLFCVAWTDDAICKAQELSQSFCVLFNNINVECHPLSIFHIKVIKNLEQTKCTLYTFF